VPSTLLNRYKISLITACFAGLSCLTSYGQEHVQKSIDGQSDYNSGDFKAAIADFKASVALKPDYLKAHFNLAMSYYKLEYFDSAGASFARVIEIDSSIALPYYYLPFCHYNNAENELALQYFNTAILKFPKKRELYYYMAVIHASNGDKDLELGIYDKLLKLYPNEYKAIIQRANLHNDLQNFKLALTDLNKAIALNEYEADAFLLRGIIHINFGRIDEGCNDLIMAEALGSVAPALLELKPLNCVTNE
tara:strand:+ start:35165 stop:35914 length:750 start_codon:yes stop_codon:yes gene_type:complete